MASDLITGPKSVQASADLSTKQYCFMKIDTNGQLAPVSSTGARSVGVLQDKPTAQGQPGTLCRPGDVTKIVLINSVTKGALVMSDNAGKGLPATSGAHILGWALDQGSAGDIIRIVYQPEGTL